MHFDWEPFVTQVFFWSLLSADAIIVAAYERIFKRAEEMEVSEPGMVFWSKLGKTSTT